MILGNKGNGLNFGFGMDAVQVISMYAGSFNQQKVEFGERWAEQSHRTRRMDQQKKLGNVERSSVTGIPPAPPKQEADMHGKSRGLYSPIWLYAKGGEDNKPDVRPLIPPGENLDLTG